MAVPLITDETIVNADDWWNPLSVLANGNEANLTAEVATRSAADTAINSRLNSTIAAGGISDLPTFRTTVNSFMAAEPALRGVIKRKSVIETVNNSATIQNDNDLVWPLAINSFYILGPCSLFYDSSTVADLQIQWFAPAGASMLWGAVGLDTALAVRMSAGLPSAAPSAFGGAGAGAIRQISLSGVITTGGTAGSLVLQWAQNTLEATNTNMQPGSFGVLTLA